LDSGTINEMRLESIGNVYGDTDETNFFIETCSDGKVRGFRFFTELYILQPSEPCPGNNLNLDSVASSEIISRAFEVFRYVTPMILENITCSFIPAMGDNYDFMVGFSQFRTDKPLAGSGMGIFRNSISGIGLGVREPSSNLCSDSRLQAAPVYPWYIDSPLGEGASPDGLDDSYDFFLSMAGHELAHRWIASVDAIVDGQLIELQDNWCNCHWIEGLHAPAAFPFKESQQASPMGGGYWRDNDNGTFTQFADSYFVPASGYSYLDLYLMGLIPADEVPDFFLIDNLSLMDSDAPDGPLYSGNRIDITIEDIIASAGPRIPSFSESQKDFNTAFIYLTEPGTEADPDKINRLATIRDRFSEYWSHVTGGASTMNLEFTGDDKGSEGAQQVSPPTGPVPEASKIRSITGATTDAIISAGAYANVDTPVYSNSFTTGDFININAEVRPDNIDIGKDGELLVVLLTLSNKGQQWSFLNTEGSFESWDLQLSSLGPAKIAEPLAAINTLTIFEGELQAGKHRIAVGYRTNSGQLIYTTKAINITVSE